MTKNNNQPPSMNINPNTDPNIDLGIEHFVPHRRQMLLLDRLLAADEAHARACVTLHDGSAFMTAKGVPALVGIEYIAQTVAAYSGARDLALGQAPKIGLLLGSRRYHSETAFFQCGQTLVIDVSPVYMEDNSLGVFNGEIRVDDNLIVTATLNVFQPADISGYF